MKPAKKHKFPLPRIGRPTCKTERLLKEAEWFCGRAGQRGKLGQRRCVIKLVNHLCRVLPACAKGPKP